ncbi:MAG: hypothetical protein WD512_19420 [Candidatus Paceibacterota bacterium]
MAETIPTQNNERETFMDALRGFAILGIFIANLFCRIVIAITLVLILINGITFFKFFFYLIKKELHEQTTRFDF